MHSLITTVLLDMDVKLNGEGRELVPGQENIEHLICYTKQQPPILDDILANFLFHDSF